MTRKYFRQPEAAASLYDRIDSLEESGEISEELSLALYIAVGHQSQLDYDGLQEEYDETDSEELQSLLEDVGVVLVLTEEQTRAVKYGV